MGYGSKAGSAEGGSEASYNTEERERLAQELELARLHLRAREEEHKLLA